MKKNTLFLALIGVVVHFWAPGAFASDLVSQLEGKSLSCHSADSSIAFSIANDAVTFSQNSLRSALDVQAGTSYPILDQTGDHIHFAISIYLNQDGAGNLDFSENGSDLIVHFYGYNTNDGQERTSSFSEEMVCDNT